MTILLSVQGVTKRFGGLQALTDVTFDLPEGQILGLIGPTKAKTYHHARMGMARTHQIVQPLNELTVRENVMVGACFGRENQSLGHASEIAEEVLEFVGLESRIDQMAGSLNVAQKKRLEMARALASRPYLILLDEVLAGLNPSEIGNMVETVKKIRERGITIIMIEHVMKAIMNVSDRIIVLDYGMQIAEGNPEEISSNEKVIEAYLGDPKLAEKLLQEQED